MNLNYYIVIYKFLHRSISKIIKLFHRIMLNHLLTELSFHVRLFRRLPSRLASPLAPLFPITARSLLQIKRQDEQLSRKLKQVDINSYEQNYHINFLHGICRAFSLFSEYIYISRCRSDTEKIHRAISLEPIHFRSDRLHQLHVDANK